MNEGKQNIFQFDDLLEITSRNLIHNNDLCDSGLYCLEEADMDTDDIIDIDVIEQKRFMAKEMSEQVLPKIRAQIDFYTDLHQTYADLAAKSIDWGTNLLTFMNITENHTNAIQEKLEGLYARKSELEQQITQIYRDLQLKVDEVNSNAQKLNKWFWVPFYNISLLSEYQTSLDSYKQKYETFQAERDALQKEIDSTIQSLNYQAKLDAIWEILVRRLEYENATINDQINWLSRMVAQWNQFYQFFLRLDTDISTLDDVEETLQSVNTQLELASEAEKEAEFDFSPIPENLFMNCYEILTYDREYTTSMVLGLNLYKTRVKTLFNIPNLFKVTCTTITFLDGSSLIFFRNTQALTYSEEHNLMVTPLLMDNNDLSSNQLFQLTKCPEEEDTYKISLYNHSPELYLDSSSSILMFKEDNDTVNQKFILKKCSP